jgi:hypothetical protein
MDDTSAMDEPAGTTLGETVDLRGTVVETVEADEVYVHQGGVNRVFAGVVEMDTGGAVTIDAETVSLNESVGVVVRADVVEANESGIGVLVARDLRLTNSRAGVTVADHADLHDSSTVVLLAREVNGPVEAMLDTRGAILAGLAAGVAVGLIWLAGGLIARRRS